MHGVYFTLQKFLTHAKGVTYIIIVLALLAFLGFWRFLAGNDDDEE